MKKFWNSLFINTLFFYGIGVLVVFLCLAYVWPVLFFPVKLLLLGYAIVCLLEIVLLYSKSHAIACTRSHRDIFSLGDTNTISLEIQNQTERRLKIQVLEELPYQLQIRDLRFDISLDINEKMTIKYEIAPKERGLYQINYTVIYILGNFSLFQRRVTGASPSQFSVYPSIVQLKKYQLQSNMTTTLNGLRKLRKVGHNYEFDHIKNYVKGDDYRSINWKMTGKRNALMVNQYDDERSQHIYSIIDTGRSMQLPFGGLTLLDYSINTALVLANTATNKHDKTGLISFSKTIQNHLKAESGQQQLNRIYKSLYNERETDFEADFELLYLYIRRNVSVRSVLFLFTNFESIYSLQRVIPLLRGLNSMHLLVVVFYENDELKKLSNQSSSTVDEIYTTTIAEKMIYEKKQLAGILRQHGIQTILTQPKDLSIHTVNKYIELKSRGLA